MVVHRYNVVILFILLGIIIVLLMSRFKSHDPIITQIAKTGIVREIPPLEGRFATIMEFCGELCDMSKPVEPSGGLLGTVKAKVDCKAIFESEEIDRPADHPPIPWEQIPENLQVQYNHMGQIEVEKFFIDEKVMGSGRTEELVFSKDDVQGYIDAFLAGKGVEGYVNSIEKVNKTAEYIGIEGKTILVIGSQTPWLEAVLLAKNPKYVMTLEYGSFKSEYPNFDFVKPDKFRQMYKEGKMPSFDVIFSYSSLEHSGLGRYGDALNPWGDIITMARASCVSAPNAKAAITVPVYWKDTIQFNAHRVYGPILYPYLMTNWKLDWMSSDGSELTGKGRPIDWEIQPVFVFDRI